MTVSRKAWFDIRSSTRAAIRSTSSSLICASGENAVKGEAKVVAACSCRPVVSEGALRRSALQRPRPVPAESGSRRAHGKAPDSTQRPVPARRVLGRFAIAASTWSRKSSSESANRRPSSSPRSDRCETGRRILGSGERCTHAVFSSACVGATDSAGSLPSNSFTRTMTACGSKGLTSTSVASAFRNPVLIDRLEGSGQQQDRNVCELWRLLDVARDFVTVLARHRHIGKDDVRWMHVHARDGLVAVADGDDLDALVGKCQFDYALNRGAVVGQKQGPGHVASIGSPDCSL